MWKKKKKIQKPWILVPSIALKFRWNKKKRPLVCGKIYLFFIFVFKNPEFWSHRVKIPVKKKKKPLGCKKKILKK